MEIKMKNPVLVVLGPNKDKIVARLEEENGTRGLAILFNPIPAYMLECEIEEYQYRPEIFGFVGKCLKIFSANIEKVVIYDLIDLHYTAYVVIRDTVTDKTHSPDLHVTDALALAVAVKCPIFVKEDVFKKLESALKEARKKQPPKESDPKEAEKIEKMIEELRSKKLRKN